MDNYSSSYSKSSGQQVYSTRLWLRVVKEILIRQLASPRLIVDVLIVVSGDTLRGSALTSRELSRRNNR